MGRLFEEPRPYAVIEVSGERWTGKSSLLAALSAEAAARGWTTATGRAASQPLTGVSFGLYVDALDDFAAESAASTPTPRPAGHRESLARVLPSVHPGLTSSAPLSPYDRYRAFRALSGELVALAQESTGGLLLALDDLHWADRASLALTSYLVRHPPNGPVVVALTYRPRQLDLALQGLLGQARREGKAYRLVPDRLSDRSARALLPRDLSRVHCEAMLAESDGNPGLLKAYASARTLLDGHEPVPVPLPRDVVAENLKDFRSLSEPGWLVARAAAVLGVPSLPHELQQVSQVDGEGLRSAIDELIRDDLLRTDFPTPRLRFSNPVLRAVAYASSGHGWLLGAHARAAKLSAAADRAPVRLASHLERAGQLVGTDRTDVLLEAAAAQLWHHPAQAASWARSASDAAASPRVAERSGLLLAASLTLHGRASQALAALRALEEAATAETPARLRADVSRWHAEALRLLGRTDAAAAVVTAARAAAPAEDAEVQALLLGAELHHALEAGTPVATAAGGPDPRGAAERLSGPDRAWLHSLRAAAFARDGATAAARTHATTAAALLDRVPDRHLGPYLDALRFLAQAESRLGLDAQALDHHERGLRLAESRRLTVLTARFALAVARTELAHGDHDSAHRHLTCAETAAASGDATELPAACQALRAALGDTVRGPRPVETDLGGTGHGTPVPGSPLGQAGLTAAEAGSGLAVPVPRAGGLSSAVPFPAPADGVAVLSFGVAAPPAAARPADDPAVAAVAAVDPAGGQAAAGGGVSALTHRSARGTLCSLSNREWEISVLVSGGRTNQQIARALAISHKTVETHLGRIFKKLTVSSRAELAALVGRVRPAPGSAGVPLSVGALR